VSTNLRRFPPVDERGSDRPVSSTPGLEERPEYLEAAPWTAAAVCHLPPSIVHFVHIRNSLNGYKYDVIGEISTTRSCGCTGGAHVRCMFILVAPRWPLPRILIGLRPAERRSLSTGTTEHRRICLTPIIDSSVLVRDNGSSSLWQTCNSRFDRFWSFKNKQACWTSSWSVDVFCFLRLMA